jgi:hypothetical protein
MGAESPSLTHVAGTGPAAEAHGASLANPNGPDAISIFWGSIRSSSEELVTMRALAWALDGRRRMA